MPLIAVSQKGEGRKGKGATASQIAGIHCGCQFKYTHCLNHARIIGQASSIYHTSTSDDARQGRVLRTGRVCVRCVWIPGATRKDMRCGRWGHMDTEQQGSRTQDAGGALLAGRQCCSDREAGNAATRTAQNTRVTPRSCPTSEGGRDLPALGLQQNLVRTAWPPPSLHSEAPGPQLKQMKTL